MFIGGGDAAFLDTGSRGDPFIRCLDHLGQFGIGQDFLRDIKAGSGNLHGLGECGHGILCGHMSQHVNASQPQEKIYFKGAI
ncbi:hypothetical protein QQ054_34405 [Oscillatoria amoena NRMC-F 0135]|nr:hypothetical protein [Oscillatoria amoena NRMC-F 0135]